MHVDPSIFEEYEAVIGLEIHVQLNTKSKLFSSAPNRFGDEPNTNITEVCTGQPGALPTLNKEAVKKAVLFGCAINGTISTYSRFDRKSYFYPDSPRNFQITQFDYPIIRGGTLIADVHGIPKSFSINRAHLEDDAGMLKHFTDFAGVDYNRAGAPLIEIVSEPCMFSSKEAVAYAIGMRALLQYLDVSDCNMEEGSLRIDANISVRRKGEHALRNKIEIKNMNSFNFLGLALEAEFKRQVALYEKHADQPIDSLIKPATYRWDLEKKEAVMMRFKESADDYRYFLEPDLPPLIIEQEYIDSIKSSIGELPYQREKRYIQDYYLSPELASIIVNEKALSVYFEQALTVTSNAKSVSNWIVGEFGGRLKESCGSLAKSGISPENVGTLVNLIDNGTITGPIAKKIADIMVAHPHKKCEEIIKETPEFQPMSNETELRSIIIDVLEKNKQSVEDYKKGKEKAFGFLVGQVMQATKGKASPIIVNSLLKELL
jgi:aspartyl-tRNA(Asn)/glutamyl-tRNA(Gln) amidotransferase subunit B